MIIETHRENCERVSEKKLNGRGDCEGKETDTKQQQERGLQKYDRSMTEAGEGNTAKVTMTFWTAVIFYSHNTLKKLESL